MPAKKNYEREVLAYIDNNLDASLDQLAVVFPKVDIWTLRECRRKVYLDRNGSVAPATALASSPLQSLSKPAKSALSAGFFNTVKIVADVPRPVKPVFKKAAYQYLVVSDLHAPAHDPNAIDVVTQIGQAADVDELVVAGDFFDCHSLSKYVPTADRPIRWVDERAEAVPVLAALRASFDGKPATLLYGNHDNRPDRWIASNAVALQGLFTLDELLGIQDLDFQKPENNALIIEDKLQIIHGERVRKDAGASVKAEVLESGMSTIMGHVHRRALYELTLKSQEIRGDQPLIGVELGCLADLHPGYLAKEKTANWQHGAAIVSVYGDGLLDVEQIRIHRGVALFRGLSFTSRS